LKSASAKKSTLKRTARQPDLNRFSESVGRFNPDWSLAKIKIAAYRRIFCHELLELDKFSAQL
jgi:hypothetical protein